MTEALSEQVDKWYCTLCVETKSLKMMWKSSCHRPGCFERAMADHLYCSNDCALAVAVPRYQAICDKLVRKKHIPDPYRSEMKSRLQDVIEKRELYKTRIRNLEKRQLFIDCCIEKAHELRKVEQKLCAFDHRILEYGINDQPCAEVEDIICAENLENVERSDNDLGTTSEDHFLEYCCKFQGRCPLHENWEVIKSREVEIELAEQVRFYCLGKRKEMTLALKLTNRTKRDTLMSQIKA